MSSALYLVGYAVIIIGLALGASYLGISTRWIVVGVLVLVGMGLTGLARVSPEAKITGLLREAGQALRRVLKN